MNNNIKKTYFSLISADPRKTEQKYEPQTESSTLNTNYWRTCVTLSLRCNNSHTSNAERKIQNFKCWRGGITYWFVGSTLNWAHTQPNWPWTLVIEFPKRVCRITFSIIFTNLIQSWTTKRKLTSEKLGCCLLITHCRGMPNHRS